MNEKERRELLKSEYLHIQSVIEAFDEKVLTVKAWSITFSLAAIAGAFAADSSAVLLVASFSALIFWFLEGQWKSFQYAYYDRSEKIEKYFNGQGQTHIKPMQIGSSWYANWKKGGFKRLFRMMLWPHVMLPHFAVFIVGIILFSSVVC